MGSRSETRLTWSTCRPRTDRLGQVVAAIQRHRDQAGIVYCIRRSEVEELAAALVRRGFRAVRYNAGLSDDREVVS